MRETDKYIFFWGSFLSNFIPNDLKIKYNNLIFTNSEQLFMWHKAQYFRDYDKGTEILELGNEPKIAKKLGREVKNYDDASWSKVREFYMFLAIKSKFDSSEELIQKLIATGDKILVEANPFDPIWAIGLKYDNDLVLDEKNWKGINLLGKVLMNVRKTYTNV